MSVSKEQKNIEQKVIEMTGLTNDINMRLCASRFLERVSFDENYINKVLETYKKRKTFKLHNMFKSISNGAIQK